MSKVLEMVMWGIISDRQHGDEQYLTDRCGRSHQVSQEIKQALSMQGTQGCDLRMI